MTVGNKLITFLVDGFSNYYFQQCTETHLPNFYRVLKSGMLASDGLIPVFPSLTLPNFTSIFTGYHVDTHGIFNNMVYDVREQDYLNLGALERQKEKWFKDVPEHVWLSAQHQGVETSIYWPWFVDVSHDKVVGKQVHMEGYDVFVKEVLPNPEMEVPKRLAQIVEQMAKPGSQLAVFYYGHLDTVCHVYGPLSPEAMEELTFVDRMLGKLLDGLEAANLINSVNLLILSDHGHAISSAEKIIFIDDFVSTEHVEKAFEGGPLMTVYPHSGKDVEAFNDLTSVPIANVSIQRTCDIDDRLHCKRAKYAPPILVNAAPGYQVALRDAEKHPKFGHDDVVMIGVHGYDPRVCPELKAILLGTGPGLKKGLVSGTLHMVDVYLLLCELLGIVGHKNDALWENVKPLLTAS